MNVRRVRRLGLVAASALLLFAGAGSAEARTEDRPQPKVVVIVGPAGDATASYRSLAEQTATAAAGFTSNVVRVYSPDATWERVRAALQGASVVVYLGHGNGWPSIYHESLYPATEDGFGLNPESGAADAHQYFGEARIAAEIKLAPNAVVVFSHLCYASGNSEPGLPEGTLDVAQQRVDNYAAGFFRAGAGAVIADAYLSPESYVTSILRGRGTVDSIWRGAPDRNGNFLTFESTRTKGAVASMDPETPASGFVRSLVARPGLGAADVISGAANPSTDVLPAPEPSLIGLGVTFGSPDVDLPPTAGATTRLVIPMTRTSRPSFRRRSRRPSAGIGWMRRPTEPAARPGVHHPHHWSCRRCRARSSHLWRPAVSSAAPSPCPSGSPLHRGCTGWSPRSTQATGSRTTPRRRRWSRH